VDDERELGAAQYLWPAGAVRRPDVRRTQQAEAGNCTAQRDALDETTARQIGRGGNKRFHGIPLDTSASRGALPSAAWFVRAGRAVSARSTSWESQAAGGRSGGEAVGDGACRGSGRSGTTAIAIVPGMAANTGSSRPPLIAAQWQSGASGPPQQPAWPPSHAVCGIAACPVCVPANACATRFGDPAGIAALTTSSSHASAAITRRRRERASWRRESGMPRAYPLPAGTSTLEQAPTRLPEVSAARPLYSCHELSPCLPRGQFRRRPQAHRAAGA